MVATILISGLRGGFINLQESFSSFLKWEWRRLLPHKPWVEQMWERIENTQHSAWHMVNPQDVLALVVFRILLVPECVSSNSPTCFLRGRPQWQQWDAAIRQGNGDASSPILAPTTCPPGAACRRAPSWFLPQEGSAHTLTPACPLPIFLWFLWPAGLVHYVRDRK